MTDAQAEKLLGEFFTSEDKASEAATKLLEGFDKLKLTTRQKLYCLYFNVVESDSFRHQTNSYKKAFGADCSNPSGKASTLHKKVKIKSGIRLAEGYLNPTFYDSVKIEQEHWRQYEKADLDGRPKDAIKLLEMMGKSVGFYDGAKENKGSEDEKANVAQKALSIEKTKMVEFYANKEKAE